MENSRIYHALSLLVFVRAPSRFLSQSQTHFLVNTQRHWIEFQVYSTNRTPPLFPIQFPHTKGIRECAPAAHAGESVCTNKTKKFGRDLPVLVCIYLWNPCATLGNMQKMELFVHFPPLWAGAWNSRGRIYWRSRGTEQRRVLVEAVDYCQDPSTWAFGVGTACGGFFSCTLCRCNVRVTVWT